MNLLILDTATPACSAAVVMGTAVYERCAVVAHRHNQLLLRQCEVVLAEAGLSRSQLDAIVFGRGPGAFTGVRIAAAAAQGIAYALDRPVIPVSDLEALAQQLADRYPSLSRLLAVLDARMGEVYYAYFDRQSSSDELCVRGEEGLAKPDELPGLEGFDGAAAGNGFHACPVLYKRLPAVAQSKCLSELLPRAAAMAPRARREYSAARVLPPDQAVPVYIRNRVATPAA